MSPSKFSGTLTILQAYRLIDSNIRIWLMVTIILNYIFFSRFTVCAAMFNELGHLLQLADRWLLVALIVVNDPASVIHNFPHGDIFPKYMFESVYLQ